MKKLVTITRADLSPGQQAVQASHAAINFIFEHPKKARKWFNNSNYLIYLAAKDENHLLNIIKKAKKLGISYTIFREPDLDNSITSIAIEPSKKITSNLSLLLKTF